MITWITYRANTSAGRGPDEYTYTLGEITYWMDTGHFRGFEVFIIDKPTKAHLDMYFHDHPMMTEKEKAKFLLSI